MLDIELGHGEVFGVAGGQAGVDAHDGRGYEAVALAERYAPPCIVTAPASSALTLPLSEWSEMKPLEKADRRRLVMCCRAAHNLLDIHSAYPWRLTFSVQVSHQLAGGPSSQYVDQNCRVEQQQALPDTRGIATALRRDPSSGIWIPLVLTVCKRADTGFDVLPAALIVERTTDGLADERAATASPNTLVELLDEVVIEPYVQSHGHRLAHKTFSGEEPRARRAAISFARTSNSLAPVAPSNWYGHAGTKVHIECKSTTLADELAPEGASDGSTAFESCKIAESSACKVSNVKYKFAGALAGSMGALTDEFLPAVKGSKSLFTHEHERGRPVCRRPNRRQDDTNLRVLGTELCLSDARSVCRQTTGRDLPGGSCGRSVR